MGTSRALHVPHIHTLPGRHSHEPHTQPRVLQVHTLNSGPRQKCSPAVSRHAEEFELYPKKVNEFEQECDAIMFQRENSVLSVEGRLEGDVTRGRETSHKAPSKRWWRTKLGLQHDDGGQFEREIGS